MTASFLHETDIDLPCGMIRDRDARWLWHVPACLGSVLGNAWGVWTYKRRGQDKKLIAELQVNQELKK